MPEITFADLIIGFALALLVACVLVAWMRRPAPRVIDRAIEPNHGYPADHSDETIYFGSADKR